METYRVDGDNLETELSRLEQEYNWLKAKLPFDKNDITSAEDIPK